jgi:hypothetical protein
MQEAVACFFGQQIEGMDLNEHNKKGEGGMVETRRSLRFAAYCALMAVFVGCAATQKRESTGEYVDDSVVTAKIRAAIIAEPTLKMLQINVQTFKGIVQLNGFVDSAESLAKAGEVAQGVQGVRELKNDLVVK